MRLPFHPTARLGFVNHSRLLAVRRRATEKMVPTGVNPPHLGDFSAREVRYLKQLDELPSDLDRFIYLGSLRKSQVHDFYRLAIKHFTRVAPLIYTPTVGDACLEWSHIYRQPEGLYLSYERDRGKIAEVLKQWPQEEVEITVITDGSRILGLGDLGVNGMGIPIGKLALYVSCAGIDPTKVLPITVDLGTGNEDFKSDALYLGSRKPKHSREEEEPFLDELMGALTQRWPDIVIQFEDWKNPWYTLEKYGPKYTMFNDDIQGTGAVIMGGVVSAVLASGKPLKEHRLVVLGAGSAAVGVSNQIVQYFIHQGIPEAEARAQFWLVDRHGMLTTDRGDGIPEHAKVFVRTDNNGKQFKSLDATAEHVKPTILIGLSGQKAAFSKELLQKMAKWNRLPIIFPLSNPVSHSECTYSEALAATEGRALFASGSPFSHTLFKGSDHHPSQGNNMYVFPGIGLGAILSKATRVTEYMIYASGEALPELVTDDERSQSMLYPSLERIQEVSQHVTLKVIRAAQRDKVDREESLRGMDDKQLAQWIKSKAYDPFELVD